MADVDWMLKGPELTPCNCAWGCPCQFNSLPTNGNCRAAVAMHGFEYHTAEYASSSTHATGKIAPDWKAGHAHLSMLHLTPKGPVH